ncbi:MAG: SemiSWEET transporter [Pseudomonadota bacterium]
MNLVVAIGSAAALASTISFAPQALKIIRSGKTSDISAGMYIVTVAAFALWVVYGALLRQWPLVASNSVCLVLAGFILSMKLLPSRTTKAISRRLTGR